MPENPDRPKNTDAVLGGKTPAPVSGLVLGGIEGAKHRLTSKVVEHRIAALSKTLNYGDAGLDLLIQALDDEVEQVREAACLLFGKSAQLTLLNKGVAVWNHWRVRYHIRGSYIYPDLSGTNLSGGNFSGYNFWGADLSEADLNAADLSNADLGNAKLSGANLRKANLKRANLSEANLCAADLSGAKLTEAYLSRAKLSKANLYEANLAFAELIETNFWGANLSKAYLWKATMSKTVLSQANLKYATMPDGKEHE